MSKKTRLLMPFTFKSIETIIAEGGSQSWRLNKEHAHPGGYFLCVRHRNSPYGVQGPEDHRTGFFIGDIADVTLSTDPSVVNAPEFEKRKRYRLVPSKFAIVSIPNVNVDRWPVTHTTIEDMGIDLASIDFKPFPPKTLVETVVERSMATIENSLGMTEQIKREISLSKESLSERLGVPSDRIDISIRF